MCKAPFLHCTHQHLLFVFLMRAILVSMRGDLKVLLARVRFKLHEYGSHSAKYLAQMCILVL